MAMGGHIGFQIASVICLTITFISGYFAVDKGSWGKNPHHVRPLGGRVWFGVAQKLTVL